MLLTNGPVFTPLFLPMSGSKGGGDASQKAKTVMDRLKSIYHGAIRPLEENYSKCTLYSVRNIFSHFF